MRRVVTLYDAIGRQYTATRRPDPRLEAAIHAALGDARSVVNVGAGAGAYEPRDREVIPVEPSATMRAQRPPGAPAAIDAGAEALPLADGSVDAALAVLTDHHWADRARGLRELRRVARDRVVLFTFDPATYDLFWLTTDYLPAFADLIDPPYRRAGHWERELRELLDPGLRVEAVPIPHDCTDGFYGAWWRRPEAYLDPVVRANISVFSRLDPAYVRDGLERLAADLASGAWHQRHAALLAREELELGYRLVVASGAGRRGTQPA